MPVTKKSVKKAVTIVRPTVLAKAGENQLKAFMEFIRTQGVIGLAVGLVLGGAVSILVKSLVDNVIMPPLGLLLGSAEGLKGLTWIMGVTTAGKPATLQYGTFLNDFINFIVIALVIYALVRLLKVDKLDKK
jgi:large conductance mechanosensitive channel